MRIHGKGQQNQFTLLSLAGLIGIISFLSGIQIGRYQQAEPTEVKDHVRTIAVVNMDEGIRVGQEAVNYGTRLTAFMSDQFYNTNLEDARTGAENGKYAAYIIIPVTFSSRVWSINTVPQKATLEYAINPRLQEDILPDVIYDLKSFEMRLNTDISYLYLHSILEEFHTGQESAVTIMKNDKQDLARLTAIIPEELLQPLAFAELSLIDEYPQDLDFSEDYKKIEEAVALADEGIDTYAAQAEEDREELRNEASRVLEEAENLNVAISDMTLLEDEDGNAVYADGRAKLEEELLNYKDTVTAERQHVINAFQWAAKRDTLASASDANGNIDPSFNTWLDQIRQEHLKQNREYEEKLSIWVEGFDYSKLATPCNASPSNATPSNATPSNATPSNATPSNADDWLVERDTAVVMSTMDAIYEKIAEELTELILDEDEMEEVLGIVRRYCTEEELVREYVEPVSRGNPITFTGNPEMNEYLAEFFNSMPSNQGTLDTILDQVSDEIIVYFQSEIAYLSNLFDLSTEIFDTVFKDYVIRNLDIQETRVQSLITEQLHLFESEFDEYKKKLNDYDPFYDLDRGGIRRLSSTIRGYLSGVEKAIHEKAGKDSELIHKIEQGKDSDINALRDSLDQSYEITAGNITEVLEGAQKGRKELNEENEELLNNFTQKLPYTWNGNAANTNAYDFMVNPIETNEKKLVGSSLLAKTQSILPGNGIIIAILVIIVTALAIQNERLRRKYRKESQKE